MRALVIDDSKAVRSILGNILRQIGFGVTEAGDGREGLDRLRQLGKPDLVLVDWNMPVMDGPTFVRAVRADAAYANLRVVMVTTETEMDRVVSALEAGANEYVMKPFTTDVLLDKLHLLGIPARCGRFSGEVSKNALVVDDSRATRMILRRFLTQAGFEVAEAGGGQEGLEWLEGPNAADLVLVDWNMPDMDGPTFVRMLRARKGSASPRVIVVTSEDDPARVAAALREGADGYIQKPCTKEALVEKLEGLGLLGH